MGRIICFVSGKGGVGKTVITAGIGKALASMGKSVCLLDFDFGLNNLDLMLGLEQGVVYDLTDYIAGRCRLRQALVQDNDFDNLYYLSSFKVKLFEELNADNICETIKKVAAVFDFCLIDSPAGIGEDSRFVIANSNEIVIVTTPNISSVRDASKISNYAFNSGKQTGLIVNKIRGDLVVSNKSITEEQISKTLNLKLLGVMPEYDAIEVYSNIKSVYDCSVQSRYAFDTLANNIANNQQNKINYVSKFRGVSGLIRRKLKVRA